jgi:uncharacterized protein YdeI (YjbR/CyaY-like superfamily)
MSKAGSQLLGIMDEEKILEFPDISAWRIWLEQNHSQSAGVWLAMNKKGSYQHLLSYQEALEEALAFGWIDGKARRINSEKFALRFSPRKSDSIWSSGNKEKAESMIASGRMTPGGLAKIEEARKNGRWDAAANYQTLFELPADLEKALKENAIAWQNFQDFANSYRNSYIFWVNNAKTAATREKRISEVLKRAILKIKPV